MFRNRLAVSIVFFINGFLFSNWAARIPRLQADFQMDNRMLGIVLLSAAIGSLIAMPFTGWLTSMRGSRQITAVASILYVASIPFFTIMPNVLSLLVAFFFMGVFVGVMDVAMNAQAVIVEQQFDRPIMSFFHAIFSAGMMLGAGSGALFSYLETTLTQHLLPLSFLCVVLWTWAFRNLVHDEPIEDDEAKAFFHIPDRALLAIGIIAFCCMLGEGAMSDWSANYLKQIIGTNESTAAIGLFSFSTAMMIGRFAGDRAREKFGDRRLVIYESILSAIGIGLAILIPSAIAVMVGFFLVGIGLATIVPIAYSRAGTMPGLKPGVGIGMVTTIGYSGFIVGPPVIGFLADWMDLKMAFIFVLGLFLLMLVLATRLGKGAS